MGRWIHALLAVLLWTGPVLAQHYEEQPAKGLGPVSSATEWIIAAVFLAGCLVVAFKPAKRANLR